MRNLLLCLLIVPLLWACSTPKPTEGDAPSEESCRYVAEDSSCLDTREQACAAISCADEACICTEAGTKDTCTCRDVEPTEKDQPAACRYVADDGACHATREALCDAMSCPDERCLCTEAGTRDTCTCRDS